MKRNGIRGELGIQGLQKSNGVNGWLGCIIDGGGSRFKLKNKVKNIKIKINKIINNKYKNIKQKGLK